VGGAQPVADDTVEDVREELDVGIEAAGPDTLLTTLP
jgi:hypothetical protein